MPSMVIDVSAMFVAMTTLRAPGGAGSKILVCISDGSAEYTGSTISCGEITQSGARARKHKKAVG